MVDRRRAVSRTVTAGARPPLRVMEAKRTNGYRPHRKVRGHVLGFELHGLHGGNGGGPERGPRWHLARGHFSRAGPRSARLATAVGDGVTVPCVAEQVLGLATSCTGRTVWSAGTTSLIIWDAYTGVPSYFQSSFRWPAFCPRGRLPFWGRCRSAWTHR